jgi:predicted nucleic acid-binding protein
VRAYADTSFLVKLLAREAGTEAAMAEFRRWEYPRLFLLPLHRLEAENAIRQKVFHARKALPARERGALSKEKTASLSRFELMLKRGQLREVTANWDVAFERARSLSEKYTETRGTRSLDLLHLAFALELEAELFFTTDRSQEEAAKAEGLRVASISD